MPQLVREARYFSHCEHGVEMGESMSLACQLWPKVWAVPRSYQCPPSTL